ncbi:MAG: hypothetical protein ABIP74_00870 [Candidatus Saccharimonas sp.]
MAFQHHRGDTLVEIILAFAIFSLAAVAVIALMNKGLALSQHSLETTLVRQQMDGQAEIVRYLRDTSNTLWDSVKFHALNTKVAPLAPSSCPKSGDIASAANGLRGFFITKDISGDNFTLHDVDASNFSLPATYAHIDRQASKAYGLWVQVAQAEDSGKAIKAYDLYIHACWDSVAMKNIPATLGTIVRIYDK